MQSRRDKGSLKQLKQRKIIAIKKKYFLITNKNGKKYIPYIFTKKKKSKQKRK